MAGGLSKEAVAEAIKMRAEGEKAAPKKTSALDSVKGMLSPKSAPGAAAKRKQYQDYVEEAQADGKKAATYEEWASGKW